ncbi:MAG: hypothetical protein JJT76_08240 [Clostridiaceae bacterium]|nr:hypothetical protein [Clostridiaceae bacterium]
MTKEPTAHENLEFTIPTIHIQPHMIISKEILNDQDNILVPKNYKVKDHTAVNRIKRLLGQNNIEMLHVRVEKEITNTQLESLMGLQIDTLEEEKTEKENPSLEKVLMALDIKDKDFFKNTLIKCEQKFNRVFESIAEDNLKEVDTLGPEILESMKIIEKSSSIFQIMDKFKKLEDSFYMHCYNMAITSYMLGKWLNIDKDKNKELFACAMVADIGLLKVSPSIRYEPLNLSEKDQSEYRKHVEHSYTMLKNVTFISESSKQAILCHHETVDKSGFPFKYDGKKIPLFSKIMYVAHLYCYYTQTKKENPLKAIDLIYTNHLKEVDLDIFYIFRKRIYNYFIGQKVKINTEINSTGDVVLVDFINSSILVKKDDDSFISISLETFHSNLAEFI